MTAARSPTACRFTPSIPSSAGRPRSTSPRATWTSPASRATAPPSSASSPVAPGDPSRRRSATPTCCRTRRRGSPTTSSPCGSPGLGGTGVVTVAQILATAALPGRLRCARARSDRTGTEGRRGRLRRQADPLSRRPRGQGREGRMRPLPRVRPAGGHRPHPAQGRRSQAHRRRGHHGRGADRADGRGHRDRVPVPGQHP